MKFRELSIADPRELVFGHAPRPVVTARGLSIGAGRVHPELNFTVPSGTVINRTTLPALREMYTSLVRDALKRACDLHVDGIVLEFETLVEMTTDPFIGTELVKAMNDICQEYADRHGLKSEIRLTPNDARDFDRPARMRTSRYLEPMFALFEEGARAGGNLLSIESTGGKEICDEALTMGQVREVIFALAVLGVRDMRFLWPQIVEIAARHGRIAGGDTACGFANTAMVLAEMNYIPRTFAAIVRIASVVRSLVAIEEGATGPDKDCGYEGVFLKAIAGIPISMEGKTAACAHLSPVGNVASACADLWSNESVQNIKLLGGMAPTVYAEQLAYDCRLMNAAIARGRETMLGLRDLLVESDVRHDPQALILAPANVIRIAGRMVTAASHLEAAVLGCLEGLDVIEAAVDTGELAIDDRERIWIDMLRNDIDSIPRDEGEFVDQMLPSIDPGRCLLEEYGL